MRTVLQFFESVPTARQLRIVEFLFLIVLVVIIFTNKAPLSTDGATYTEWYRALGSDPKKPCAGFEIGFCGATYILNSLHLPSQYFLKFWSLFIYVTCYIGIIRLTPNHPTNIFIPAIFLSVALFVYLPLSITEHLTRQYVAGSLIVLGLSSKKPLHLLIYIMAAGSFHIFALMLAPVAIALWSRATPVFLIISIGAALYFSTLGNIVDVASAFFSQVSWYGEMLHNEFLKSAAFRYNLYVTGFSQSFGYPEISFRGISISFVFLLALSVHFKDKRFIYTGVISIFTFILWIILFKNDLISHRVYHYVREISIIPTCCSISMALTAVYNWIGDKYRPVGEFD